MKHFSKLFEPRSIAVVGVSEDPVRPGSQAVHALLTNGYTGRVYPVNPKYSAYEGMTCYPAVSAIDGEINVAVIGVPAAGVVPVIEECARKGVRFAVVPSGGFRESGAEGAARQDRIVTIAREAGMRIVGPNCLGYVNVHNHVYAGFGSITRPPKLKKGSVSLVTQSGGFGYSLALACAQAGIGFRNIIATGNEADIDTVEFLDALLEDDETRIVLAYMEGLRDGRAFFRVANRALAMGKPLLVWKGGVTDAGARAAATHTANLTGSYDYYRGMFRQAGIIEIAEIHEAADYIKALQAQKLPRGGRVAVMGGSGGSAIVFADAAERVGLQLSSFADETKRQLSEVVPSIGAVHNPVDFTAGYIAAGNERKFQTAVKTVLADPGVDGVCLNFATTSEPACLAGAQVLRAVANGTKKPVLVFLATPATEAASLLAEAHIPVLPSPVRVARAIAMLVGYRKARERRGRCEDEEADTGPADASLETAGASLSEWASKRVLKRIGIAVTRDVLVQRPGDIPFEALALPLAVKIASPDIAHKTDIGGVRLDIRTREELDSAIDQVLTNARTMAPEARIEGVIVSEMVTEGFELIAGTVNDAVFGPVVVVGAGGVHAESLDDTACRLAPFDEQTAREMIGELRCRRLLDGARGRPALNVDAVAHALAALSRYAWENRARVAEIDVNPLFALPAGAVAADALIIQRG